MRQRILSTVIVFLLSGLVVPHPLVWGFEVITHELMSEEAAEQSDLKAHLPLLGLNLLDDPVTSKGLLGILPGSVHEAIGWIQLGAREEDKVIGFFSLPLRFRNHFYNPSNNGSGLAFSPDFPCSIGGIQSGPPSPDWGLEEGAVDPEEQEYSFRDARDYFHQALTKPEPADRENAVTLLLRTLGQVMHLIQDLAQPQHTRNDPHGPWCFGTGSFYEKYTEGVKDLPLKGYRPVYDSTDTTTFNTPRKFWHGAGKGFAEYTNRSFVTTGTNFDTFPSGNFPEPDLNLTTNHDEDKSVLCREIGLPIPPGPEGPLPCIMRFVETSVTDLYRPSQNAQNTKASTYSILNADLKTFN